MTGCTSGTQELPKDIKIEADVTAYAVTPTKGNVKRIDIQFLRDGHPESVIINEETTETGYKNIVGWGRTYTTDVEYRMVGLTLPDLQGWANTYIGYANYHISEGKNHVVIEQADGGQIRNVTLFTK